MIEDHTLVREGLRALLREHSEFKIVGEASEGKLGLKLVEKHKPDLVLLDLILPREPLWEAYRPVLLDLNNYAVAYRYPGQSATREMAKQAVADCKVIRQVIRSSLRLAKS